MGTGTVTGNIKRTGTGTDNIKGIGMGTEKINRTERIALKKELWSTLYIYIIYRLE